MTVTPVGAPDLVERLVRHGLGQGEARCYVAMLAPRAFRVSEVAYRAGLPRSRTYELIRSLVRMGLCTEVAGAVQRFRAVPPNEAIGRLETFLTERTHRRRLALVSVLHALNGLERERRSGSRREPVQTLHRGEQLLEAYRRALSETQHEVACLSRTPWSLPSGSDLARSCARGVTHRAVYERAACAPDRYRARVAERAGAGEQVRLVDHLDVHVTLFDRRTILLTLPAAGGRTPSQHLESLLIHHEGLGQVLHSGFEQAWARGVPFTPAAPEGVGGRT